ncbi:WXG100 family type VII secretion target [Roseburia sp. 831b]|uniref:WXG100 family type VII secretion target n=1 Tax=Roseburia sp. 831b TaxID=1261635 RepID=UPI0009526C2C|nr:WXG100 family type VII secretion target [Roseburia sp. 831b]WVK73195.1 WXG100 family type VII secretion target [Roseburia sp. 831b]
MAVNKVDYEVLTNGVSVYANQAEALDEVIQALVKMNGELQNGWTNQTADAFIERFEDEYKPALENARDAVQSISDFIQNYMQNRQDDDAQGAAAVRA